MATPERRSWLNRWWLPFLWIILTPIITLPLSGGLFDALAGYHTPEEVGLRAINDPDCLDFACVEYEYFQVGAPTVMAFALPGLLNLAPLAWLSSRNAKVRTAAVVAGALGVLRLLIPVFVLLNLATVTNAAGESYAVNPHSILGDVFGGADEPFSAVWDKSLLAWLASCAVWVVFGILSGLILRPQVQVRHGIAEVPHDDL